MADQSENSTTAPSTSESSTGDITIIDYHPQKGKRSWVWTYCGFPKENGTISKDKTICKLCKGKGKVFKMPFSGNTSTMGYDLNQLHYSEVHGGAGLKKKG